MALVRSSPTQPQMLLISRPAYGESGLPGTGPSDKGRSLDKDIPGTSTFNKPEGDIRQFDKADEGSIYRIDGPDDRAKPQDNRRQDERDHGDFKPTQEPPGGRPPDSPTVTDYPYRDDRPHKHYASAAFVLESFLAKIARPIVLESFAEEGLHTAATLGQIEQGLNPKFVQRSKSCAVTLKRADIPNMRWLFAVDCGNGAKVVRIHATRSTRATQMKKLDLHLSCSCPAWRWLGPEHWSKGENYIDGQPRGTASYPIIRDPEEQNRVCKHVAAVLSSIKGWQVVPKKHK